MNLTSITTPITKKLHSFCMDAYLGNEAFCKFGYDGDNPVDYSKEYSDACPYEMAN